MCRPLPCYNVTTQPRLGIHVFILHAMGLLQLIVLSLPSRDNQEHGLCVLTLYLGPMHRRDSPSSLDFRMITPNLPVLCGAARIPSMG